MPRAGLTRAALLKAAIADAALGAVRFGSFPVLTVGWLTIGPAPCPVVVTVNDHAQQHDYCHQPGKQFPKLDGGVEGNFVLVNHVKQGRDKLGQTNVPLNLFAAFACAFSNNFGAALARSLGRMLSR